MRFDARKRQVKRAVWLVERYPPEQFFPCLLSRHVQIEDSFSVFPFPLLDVAEGIPFFVNVSTVHRFGARTFDNNAIGESREASLGFRGDTLKKLLDDGWVDLHKNF